MSKESIFIEKEAMWFPMSITDTILIKKTRQLSERLNCKDSLPSDGWLSCFKFLALCFYDDMCLHACFGSLSTEVYFFCYDI